MPIDAEEDAVDLDELTRQQFAALRGASERVAIVGPAGSGKTLFALWKVDTLLEERKRVLYVCFNKALAEHLRLANPEMSAAITSVDRLFYQLAGVPDGRRIGRTSSRKSFLHSAKTWRQNYRYCPNTKRSSWMGGLDFGELRLLELLDMLIPKGQWLFFADWEQNVYRSAKQESIGAEVTFRLYHKCRNTHLVNAATDGCCELSVGHTLGVPVGAAPLLKKGWAQRRQLLHGPLRMSWALRTGRSPVAVQAGEPLLGDGQAALQPRGH